MLCGLFYMFCIFNVLGISTNIETNTFVHNKDENVEKAIQYVNASVAREEKKIALTFDDGPSHSCTGRLLDGLLERDVKATFFLIGENAKENPKLVKRIYDEGHLIGNHTYTHVEITKISDEEAKIELEKTDHVISSTVDPLDWTTENVDEIVNKVVTETEENDIILLHDCYDSSVDAAFQIIDILKKEGFEFVTVDELMIN